LTQTILTTGRLQVLPFTEDDYPLLLELHSDPEVNRFHSPGPAMMCPEEVRRRLSDYVGDHRALGISKWKLETHDGTFVGRAGFSWQSDPEGYEMGYSFRRGAWGMGYATEIARALVAWFFERTSEDQLLAYAAIEHVASLNVMRKAGMDFWLDMEKHGRPCRFYRITRTRHREMGSAAVCGQAG